MFSGNCGSKMRIENKTDYALLEARVADLEERMDAQDAEMATFRTEMAVFREKLASGRVKITEMHGNLDYLPE